MTTGPENPCSRMWTSDQERTHPTKDATARRAIPANDLTDSSRRLTDRGSAAARREPPEYRAAADRASNPSPGGGRLRRGHAPDAGGQLQPLVRRQLTAAAPVDWIVGTRLPRDSCAELAQ